MFMFIPKVIDNYRESLNGNCYKKREGLFLNYIILLNN